MSTWSQSRSHFFVLPWPQKSLCITPWFATNYNSGHNLFLLETFQMNLTMSLLYEKISKCYPIPILLSVCYYYRLTDNISEMQYDSYSAMLVLRCKICYVMFSLFLFSVKQLYTWKYSLIKTKLQLLSNDPKKTVLYYNYNFFCLIFGNE